MGSLDARLREQDPLLAELQEHVNLGHLSRVTVQTTSVDGGRTGEAGAKPAHVTVSGLVSRDVADVIVRVSQQWKGRKVGATGVRIDAVDTAALVRV